MKLFLDGEYRKDAKGYMRNRNNKYIHQLVVEKAIGRELKGSEEVHHLDYDRSNNTPCNLVVCPDHSYHMLLHARQRILELGGHPDIDAYCSYHNKLHSKKEFSTVPSRWNGLSNYCRNGTNEYRKNKGFNTKG